MVILKPLSSRDPSYHKQAGQTIRKDLFCGGDLFREFLCGPPLLNSLAISPDLC
jgi:hypothetical protein